MSKLLRIRDYVLLIAAVGGEIAEEFRLVGGVVPSLMEARYGFVPPNYKRNSYLSTVSKLLQTGDIKRKINAKGEAFLELTTKGESRFKRKFPLLSQKAGKWDGTFMIVTFDIPESDRYARDILRNKLKELGFGQMQRSVWVTPHHFEEDFAEFIKTNGLERFVAVLKADKLLMGNLADWADKMWNLNKVNEKYKELLQKIKDLESGREGGGHKLNKIWDEYFSVLKTDPILPSEFLPEKWAGREVARQMHNLVFTKTRRS